MDIVEQLSKESKSVTTKQQNEIEEIQIQLRQINLIIVGLKDYPGETEVQLRHSIGHFFKNALGIDVDIPIDSCYRFGAPIDSNRKIKVKFCTQFNRDLVYSKRVILNTKKLKIYINEDLPPATQFKMKQLRDEVSKARSLGKQSSLRGRRLVIDQKLYDLEDGQLIEYKKTQGNY